MKVLDEHIWDQLIFRSYDVIWWYNNVKSFLKETKCACSPPESMHVQIHGPESMHAQMGNLSQCMPECGEGFLKILLALWATWFICFACNHCFSESFLTQQALHPYNISCIVIPQWQPTHWWHHFKVNVNGQGHAIVRVGCQRNPYFLSSFYQINSKLCVKVANGLPLSWLIFGLTVSCKSPPHIRACIDSGSPFGHALTHIPEFRHTWTQGVNRCVLFLLENYFTLLRHQMTSERQNFNWFGKCSWGPFNWGYTRYSSFDLKIWCWSTQYLTPALWRSSAIGPQN
jgi:hypothetical protein